MISSLPNFVNNLAEGIHIIKCKYGHNNETCGNKYKNVSVFLNTQT